MCALVGATEAITAGVNCSIRTRRLVGEPLGNKHFDWLMELNLDPRVSATLTRDGLPVPESQVWAGIERAETHWAQHGFGLWVFHLDGVPVARGGPKWCLIDGDERIEIAYAVSADYWGQGVATEMANASVEFCFDPPTDSVARIRGLPAEELVCFTLPWNVASRRVMYKVGFRGERDVMHAGLPHVLVRLRRPEWVGGAGER